MSQLFQTPFGRHSTTAEVIDGVDLSGKRAIVTGAGSGIGTETARALAWCLSRCPADRFGPGLSSVRVADEGCRSPRLKAASRIWSSGQRGGKGGDRGSGYRTQVVCQPGYLRLGRLNLHRIGNLLSRIIGMGVDA
jgi:hypothetical protein